MTRLMTMGLFLLFLSGRAVAAPPREPGIGVVVGDPVGGVFRYFMSDTRSLDLGVGFSGDAVFWADHAWHAWDLLPRPQSGEFDLWVSAGVRVEADDDAEFGIRTMLGGSYWFPQRPIELFVTAGPVFQMTPHGGVGADGGLGVRFYFGGKGG
jgi:hypothetical protein